MSAKEPSAGVVVALPEVLKTYSSARNSVRLTSALSQPISSQVNNLTTTIDILKSDVSTRGDRALSEGFRPYLLVEAGMPNSTLISSQDPHQYLSLHNAPDEMEHQALLEFVYEFIQEHMRKNEGKLHGYGYIRRYYLVYAESEMLELSPAGHILGIREAVIL